MSATILKIDEPTCPEACERVKALCAAIECFMGSGQDRGLADYLNSIELEEEDDDIEDLRQWLPALVHFDALLGRLSARVVTTYSNPDSFYAENSDDDTEVKHVLYSVLHFLRCLLKISKEKRCFLSYKVRKHYEFRSSGAETISNLFLYPQPLSPFRNIVYWRSNQCS